MKHAIRALGWATTVLWILVILFSGTAAYSAMQIGINFEEEPEVTASNGTMTVSIPFSINNGGLYDISELDITTRLVAENKTVSLSNTTVPLISRGEMINKTHDIRVSFDTVAKNLTYMLFNDTDLNVDMFVALTYAHAIPLKISTNLTMPWGAPLYNLSIELPPVSLQQPNVSVSLSFENHAFFSLNGTISLEIVGSFNKLIGSGTTAIFVPPGGRYDDAIPMTITGDPRDVAEVHLHFDTSVFSFGPVVMPVE